MVNYKELSQNYRDMPKEEFSALPEEDKKVAVALISMTDAELEEMDRDTHRAEEHEVLRDRVMLEQAVFQSITPAEFEALPEEEQKVLLERAEEALRKPKPFWRRWVTSPLTNGLFSGPCFH